MMQNIPAKTGMSIIFDIKRLMQGQSVYENFGFSVIPIYSQLMNEEEKSIDYFINSGIFQLPIYQGTIPVDLVAQLRTSQDPLALIQQQASKFPLSDSTIIIEIVDNQRERHLEKGFETHQPSLRFMPQTLIPKVGYKALTQAQKDQTKQLSTLIPNGQQPTQY